MQGGSADIMTDSCASDGVVVLSGISATASFLFMKITKNLYLPISYLCFTPKGVITDNSNQSKDKERKQ